MMAAMKLFACTLAFASIAAFTACSSDDGDDDQPIDASTQIDGANQIDAPAACTLASTVVNCTVGNDAPCTSVCAAAYCYNFNQVGMLCTQNCTAGSIDECPTGWSCNNMGRCRPPN